MAEDHILIEIIGWIYFAAWSVSFYGQIYENFKLKSVEGMNFDFVAMNLTGFLFYSFYNTYGYFISNEQTGQVDLNDVIFAYHALFATLVTVCQAIFFERGKNRIHTITLVYLLLLWVAILSYATVTIKMEIYTPEPRLGVISFMGYFKLSISFLKYLPQLYWNWKRKSTKGWSIFNIVMDLTGGLFSFGQMVAEAAYGQDVEINIVKLILGIMVVIYDLLFIIQHYCLYRNKVPVSYNQFPEEKSEPIPNETL